MSKHVTIEQTKKRLKAQIVACWVVLVFGVMIGAFDDNAGTRQIIGLGLMVAAVIWWVVTKIRIWWHHG